MQKLGLKYESLRVRKGGLPPPSLKGSLETLEALNPSNLEIDFESFAA